MDYVTKILQPGERVLVRGYLHWIIYAPAIVSFILSVFVFWILPSLRSEVDATTRALMSLLGICLLAVAIFLAIQAWFNKWITEIAVTTKRVIYKRGFFWRRTAEMNMDKVESVIVTQSILGRILDFGSLHVRGTGEGIEHLHKIKSPIELRNCITAR
jgi:uncharacterized membrane protein YdbT with pleckstrin-like domain